MRSDAEKALREWVAAVWEGVEVIFAPQDANVSRPPRPYATVRVVSTETRGEVETSVAAIEGDDENATLHLRQFVEGLASINLFADDPTERFDDLRASVYGGRGRTALDASGLTVRSISPELDVPDPDGTQWLRRRQADVRFAHAAHRQTTTAVIATVEGTADLE